jgi:hypothetical protein
MSKQQCLVSGTVLSVPLPIPGIRHFGLVAFGRYGDGPTVISNSKEGGVIEQSFSQFCAGHLPKVEPISGSRSGMHAVAWARQRLGTPYSLFNYNCEHFVREALGAKRESPQLQLALVAFVVLAVVMPVMQRR